MIGRPNALMIDEMSPGLAPKIVQSIVPSVRGYASSTGAGVLVVEEYFELALRAADRGYVLVHGKVVMEGTSQQLLRQRAETEQAYLAASRADEGSRTSTLD